MEWPGNLRSSALLPLGLAKAIGNRDAPRIRRQAVSRCECFLRLTAGIGCAGAGRVGAMAGSKLGWAIFMNELQTTMPATHMSPESRAPLSHRAPPMLHLCLVVSSSGPRAQLWVRAAHEAHWSTIVCSSADDAIRQAVRNRVDLALVDLQSAAPQQEPLLRKLVEQLSVRHGPLLAVCGRPNDTTGEVWSRQLGVWMYLPGVDSHSDIALVCGEARNVLQKINGNGNGNGHGRH
jgi:hypothetical protein